METNIFEHFENYLQGTMTAEEKQAFESKLNDDTKLLADFEAYKMTAKMLENHYSTEKKAFQKTLHEVGKTHFNSSSKSRKVIRLNPKYFAVAAVFLLFFSLLIFNNQSFPSYEDYNQHPIATFVERGTQESEVLKAQQAFNNQEYQEAINIFETLNLEENTEWRLYYAISLIETSAFDKAQEQLLTLSNTSFYYQNKSKWYMGLLFLKQNNPLESKKWLALIDQEAEDYKAAQKIIKRLK